MNYIIFFLILITHIVFRLFFYFGYIGNTLQKNKYIHKQMPKISFDKEWLQFKKKACLILYTDFITFLMICILSYNTIDFNFNKTILSCLGIILFLIGVFIKFNAYTVIGDKGWYWYNSFASIDKINYEQKGVYRYLENPMYGLGYLALIGISFVFRSFPGLFIAFFDWIIIHAFYYLFEKD